MFSRGSGTEHIKKIRCGQGTHVAGVFDEGCDVAPDEILAVAQADDGRTVLANRDQAVELLAHDAEGESALKSLGDAFGGSGRL